jgi:hypothetical protein
MQVFLWNWSLSLSDFDSLDMFCTCFTFVLQAIHSCWFDLRTQLLALAASSGAPVMRHMLLHYWQGQSFADMPPQALELMQTQVPQPLHHSVRVLHAQ